MPKQLLNTPAPGVLAKPMDQNVKGAGPGTEREPTTQVVRAAVFARLEGAVSWNT